MLTSEKSSVWNALWLPRRPMATDHFDEGVYRRSREVALGMRNIETHPAALKNMFVVDVDHEDSLNRVMENRHGYTPNVFVENPANGHGHAIWFMADPMPTTEAALNRTKKSNFYADAIHEGLRRAVDGDPNYTGRLTKNPLHPDWDAYWRKDADKGYHFAELAEPLRRDGFMPEPEWGIKRTRGRRNAGEGNGIGEGRNADLFNDTRFYAYALQTQVGGDRSLFRDRVHDFAYARNAEFELPLSTNEAGLVAKSVVKFILKQPKWWEGGAWVTDEKFRELQRYRASLTNEPRALAAQLSIHDVTGGKPRDMSARAVSEAAGVSERTVRKYTSQPREEYIAGVEGRNAEIIRLAGEGLSQSKIAAQVSCSLSTVKNVLRKSRKK